MRAGSHYCFAGGIGSRIISVLRRSLPSHDGRPAQRWYETTKAAFKIRRGDATAANASLLTSNGSIESDAAR